MVVDNPCSKSAVWAIWMGLDRRTEKLAVMLRYVHLVLIRCHLLGMGLVLLDHKLIHRNIVVKIPIEYDRPNP
jgi:hypothetical protein